MIKLNSKAHIYKLIFFYLIVSSSVFGQSSSYYEKGLIIGVGVNTVVDSGEGFGSLFEFKDNYHFSHPFTLSLEKKLGYNHGIKLRGSSNIYRKGKRYNSGLINNAIEFYSLDLSYLYHFTKNKPTSKVNPVSGYGFLGIGNSWYNSVGDLNIHIGSGLEYVIYQEIKFQFQGLAKLALTGENANNYFQLDFGVIVPFRYILKK